MITPSKEQIDLVKTWTELYISMGLNPKNDRACKKIRDYVISQYPNSHLHRYRKNHGSHTDEEFRLLVAESFSVREIINKCNWSISGGTYTQIYRRIRRLEISTEHFLGQAYLRNKTPINKKPIEHFLTEESFSIQNQRLLKRLVAENIKSWCCEICHISTWNGVKAPLQLDHINGIHEDNRIENLRVVCPNCHAHTHILWKNKRKKTTKNKCTICKSEISSVRVTCGDTNCMSKHATNKKKW